MPIVSVLMPSYNAEKHLSESIESILSQNFTDFEFVIIDDGSTDRSWQILQKYAEKDTRIKLFRNETNRGLIFTLNRGLELCSGKYIARMDADDISLPHRLQCQYNFMECNVAVDLIGSYYQLFGYANDIVKKPLDSSSIFIEFLFSCPFGHPTIFFRRDSLSRWNLSYPNVPHAEDYALYLACIGKLSMANLPEILLYYRVHEEQVSTVNSLSQTHNSHQMRIRFFSSLIKKELCGEEQKFVVLLASDRILSPAVLKQLLEWINNYVDCDVLQEHSSRINAKLLLRFIKTARIYGPRCWYLYFKIYRRKQILNMRWVYIFCLVFLMWGKLNMRLWLSKLL